MALDTANAVAVLRDLTRTFDRAVIESPVFYPQICTEVDSDGEDEKYGWLGDMPGVREWLGDRIFHELRAAHYTLANKDWEDSLRIPKNKIADSRLGMLDALLAKLGQRAAQHPDKLLFQAIVAGETAACFDGQYFFDTDHTWGESGTQSNDLTFTAANGTTPTVDEFKGAWRQSVTAMLGFKDDRGEPFNAPTVGTNLSHLVCMVPLAMRDVAVDATEATVLSNSTNVVIDKPRVIASPYLTDAAKFYTFYTGDAIKPFVFQKREPLSRQTKGLEDIETKDVKFMTAARYNVGYLAWWNAVLTTFT